MMDEIARGNCTLQFHSSNFAPNHFEATNEKEMKLKLDSKGEKEKGRKFTGVKSVK